MVLITFALKMAQAEARIWPCLACVFFFRSGVCFFFLARACLGRFGNKDRIALSPVKTLVTPPPSPLAIPPPPPPSHSPISRSTVYTGLSKGTPGKTLDHPAHFERCKNRVT